MLGVFGFSGQSQAGPSMLTDFEKGINTNDGPDGDSKGFWIWTHDYIHLNVVSPGANGTNYAVQYDVIEHDPVDTRDAFYIYNLPNRPHLPERGGDKMSIYIKVPSDFTTQSSRGNWNVGTYTRYEPTSNDAGLHFYHIYELHPTDNWQRIILNNHPQNWNGGQQEPQKDCTWNQQWGNNPNRWHYFDGFTRLYLQPMDDLGVDGYAPPWSYQFDEVEFYQSSEPEDDDYINSISASYLGNGRFIIGWEGLIHTANPDHYEVRYSTAPINNANYSSAIVMCEDATVDAGMYTHASCDATLPITSGRVYFAISCTSQNTGLISKIDYDISANTGNATTPPIRSNPQPSGTLSCGTTQTVISLNTNKNATCKYSTIPGTDYALMTNTFSTTGGTTHSTIVSGLTDGNSYNYYVRCQDGSGNANDDDFVISFLVYLTGIFLPLIMK